MKYTQNKSIILIFVLFAHRTNILKVFSVECGKINELVLFYFKLEIRYFVPRMYLPKNYLNSDLKSKFLNKVSTWNNSQYSARNKLTHAQKSSSLLAVDYYT